MMTFYISIAQTTAGTQLSLPVQSVTTRKSHTGQIMITNMVCLVNIGHIKAILLFICPQEEQTRV